MKGAKKSPGVGIDETDEGHANKEQTKAKLWGPGQ